MSSLRWRGPQWAPLRAPRWGPWRGPSRIGALRWPGSCWLGLCWGLRRVGRLVSASCRTPRSDTARSHPRRQSRAGIGGACRARRVAWCLARGPVALAAVPLRSPGLRCLGRRGRSSACWAVWRAMNASRSSATVACSASSRNGRTFRRAFITHPQDSKHGAPGRTRTCDARFRKPTLYPLSYGGEYFCQGLRLPKAKPPRGRCTLVPIHLQSPVHPA
jgi:hypothetical protein